MRPATAVTTYAGPAGDHNDRAMAAVIEVGDGLARRLDTEAVIVGRPARADPTGWQSELRRATPTFQAMSGRLDDVMAAGRRPVSAITRCAVALATQPVVLRHRPDAVVVWLDAHGDVNVPADTTTGYLGGMALSGPLGWWDSGLGNALRQAQDGPQGPAEGPRESQAILVGARDLDPVEVAHVAAGRIALVPPGPGIGARLAAVLAGRPVSFHLDCDVLEPGTVSTDYSVPDGLSLADLGACAEAAAASEVIAVEVAEYEGPGRAGPDELLDALDPLFG